MRLLLDCKNYVTLDHVGHLLAHLFKLDGVAILHASLHINTEQLLFVHQPASPAVRTLFCECFALALTLGALLLHFHLHHAHVDPLRGLPSALTLLADLHLAALSASALTLAAIHLAIDVEVRVSPVVQLLESGFDRQFLRGSFLPAVLISSLLEPINLIEALLVVDLAFGLV